MARRILWPMLLLLLWSSLVVAENLATGASPPTTADGWLRAHPDYEWSFPRDHWPHPDYESEWWYLTGQLSTASGRHFGYQFTFFRVGLLRETPDLDSDWSTRDLIMGHAALTDLDTGAHRFTEVLYRTTTQLGGFADASTVSQAGGLIAWSRAPSGTDGTWTLNFNGEAFDLAMVDAENGFALDLSTQPLKPRVFQGPNGYSAKDTGPDAGASQYYSFTRLATEGQLVVDGDTLAVNGSSWMDKEFGSDKLSTDQVGWDWFSLQLEDGRDLMLYVLRDSTGVVDHASGTWVDAGGQTRYVSADDFELTADSRWTSPETGATYPSGWTLRIGSESLAIQPVVQKQENVGRLVTGLFYWEGAVRVVDPATDRAIGRGYVELTGYGNGRRPGI